MLSISYDSIVLQRSLPSPTYFPTRAGLPLTHACAPCAPARPPANWQVRESGVAGLGVFARAPLAQGTVLGAYPGRPRTPAEMAAKVAAAPAAAAYCFQTPQGWLLDPTDREGWPSGAPSPGMLWWPPVDATLCRINEPPPGSAGPNVVVEDDPRDPQGLLFVASRALAAGEELWLDYGPVFDRSGYGGAGRR
jgi:hypothetical protein